MSRQKKTENLRDLWYDLGLNKYLCECTNWFTPIDETKDFTICPECKTKYKILVENM